MIVTDTQGQPARPRDILIFANGEPNDGDMVQQVIHSTHQPIIAAADGGARIAQHYGFTPDIIIGDMDSLRADELEEFAAAGVHIEQHSIHKNETDLELVFLWGAKQVALGIATPRFRVIGAVGDRLDQVLSNVYLMAIPALKGIDVRMIAGRQETWLAMPGITTFEGAEGDTVSLIPLNGTVRGVRTENLYYPLHDEDLLFGPARGVSNVMNGSRAAVHVREGVLLIVHTIGRA